MKQAALQMNKENNRKKIFLALVGGICCSFLMYGFGIASTTISVADAKTHNHSIAELQTEIAELEIEYFERINALSLEEAGVLGMVEDKKVLYAHLEQETKVAYNR
ncbi:MAG: hypothetical protein MRY57_01680 [Candidatus Pacebacteria bacterium]|nr:hypothetical protein [Candidatus Paceibacterota bacterium]